MYPSRKKAAEIARDTIEIVAAGRYTNGRGEKIAVRQLVEAGPRRRRLGSNGLNGGRSRLRQTLTRGRTYHLPKKQQVGPGPSMAPALPVPAGV